MKNIFDKASCRVSLATRQLAFSALLLAGPQAVKAAQDRPAPPANPPSQRDLRPSTQSSPSARPGAEGASGGAVASFVDDLRADPSVLPTLLSPLKNRITTLNTRFGVRAGGGTVTQNIDLRLRQKDGAFRMISSLVGDDGSDLTQPFGRDSSWVWSGQIHKFAGEPDYWVVWKYDASSEAAKRVLDRPDLRLDGFYRALTPLWYEFSDDESDLSFDERGTVELGSVEATSSFPAWAASSFADDERPEVELRVRLKSRETNRAEIGRAVVFARVTGGFRVLASELTLGAAEAPPAARAVYARQVRTGGLWVPTRSTVWTGDSGSQMSVMTSLVVHNIVLNEPLSDEQLRWDPPLASVVFENDKNRGRAGYADPFAPLGKDENDRRLMGRDKPKDPDKSDGGL